MRLCIVHINFMLSSPYILRSIFFAEFAVFFPLIYRSSFMLSAISCNKHSINKPIFISSFSS